MGKKSKKGQPRANPQRPKAGQGKHNKASAAAVRSRSVGSAASREDLKSLLSEDSSGAMAPAPPATKSSAPPQVIETTTSSSAAGQSTNPAFRVLPSPIKEEHEPPPTPAPKVLPSSSTAAHSPASQVTVPPPVRIEVEETEGNPPARMVASATRSKPFSNPEPTPEVVTPTAQELAAPESSPEPVTPTTGDDVGVGLPRSSPVANDPPLLWSGSLKDHVTVEPDAPAVLDVSIDETAAAVVAEVAPTPPPAAKVPVAAKTTAAPTAVAVAPRDNVVSLTAPSAKEAKETQKDCQCTIL